MIESESTPTPSTSPRTTPKNPIPSTAALTELMRGDPTTLRNELQRAHEALNEVVLREIEKAQIIIEDTRHYASMVELAVETLNAWAQNHREYRAGMKLKPHTPPDTSL